MLTVDSFKTKALHSVKPGKNKPLPFNSASFLSVSSLNKSVNADYFQHSNIVEPNYGKPKQISFTGSYFSETSKLITFCKEKTAKLLRKFSKDIDINIVSSPVIKEEPRVFVEQVQSISDKSKAIEPESEINRIRSGINGVIRGEDELTTDDLVKLINHDLMVTTTKDISNILNLFNPADRELATRTMQRLTQYGNYKSLNDIVKQSRIEGSETFFEDRILSLPDILSYLRIKESYRNIMFSSSGDTVLLDSELIDHFKKFPTVLNELKDKGAKFFYPEGWINGINPFNQTDDLYLLTDDVVSKAKEIIKSDKSISIDDAITKVINESIIQEVKFLEIEDNFKIIQNKEALNAPPTDRQISIQLRPNRMKKRDIDTLLNKFPKEYKQVALELLAQNSRLYSPKSLSKNLQNLHKMICPDENLDGVYFFIPKISKSFGLINMQYKNANKIPSSHFVFRQDLDFITNARKFVILDDFAGTGNSLEDEYEKLLREMPNVDIVVAPVLTTDIAKLKFEDLCDSNPRLHYKAANSVQSFKTFDYYNSLDLTDKLKFLVLMQSGGFRNASNVVFPYMAPDNNNLFFNTQIAPKFLHNNNGVQSVDNFEFDLQALKKSTPSSEQLKEKLFEEMNTYS